MRIFSGVLLIFFGIGVIYGNSWAGFLIGSGLGIIVSSMIVFIRVHEGSFRLRLRKPGLFSLVLGTILIVWGLDSMDIGIARLWGILLIVAGVYIIVTYKKLGMGKGVQLM